MPDGKGAAGVLDDTVAGAAYGAETFRVRAGDEDLHGMGMVHDAVDGDILRKRNEFVSDLFGHNCYPPLCYFCLTNKIITESQQLWLKRSLTDGNTTKQRSSCKKHGECQRNTRKQRSFCASPKNREALL